jgi:hypothetical protein
MGEAEEEFARAEALLLELDRVAAPLQGSPQPVQPTQPVVEKVVKPSPNDLLVPGALLIVDTAKLINTLLPSSQYSNACPLQNNGDIIPVTEEGKVIPFSAFVINGKVLIGVLEVNENTVKVSILTHNSLGSLHCNYLNGPFTYVVNFQKRALLDTGVLNVMSPATHTSCNTTVTLDGDVINSFYNSYKATYLAAKKEEEERKKQEAEARRLEAARSVNDYNLDMFSFIETVCEEIYPTNWGWVTDIHRDANGSGVLGSINGNDKKVLGIKFPEITISNTQKRSHVIKDLFVFMAFAKMSDGRYKMSSQLYGTRLKQTAKEYNSNYRHSHLGTGGNRILSSFCLGGSSTIAVSLADLSSTFNKDKFELMLYQISAYVRHESLEGGPYIRMEQIVGRPRSSSNGNLDLIREFRTYSNWVKTSNSKIPLKLTTLNNHQKFIFDENDEEFLTELGKLTRVPFIRSANGTYVPYVVSSEAMPAHDRERLRVRMFNFRGEALYFEIDHVESAVEVEQTKYPSPSLTTYIKKKIEDKINLLHIKKSQYELS